AIDSIKIHKSEKWKIFILTFSLISINSLSGYDTFAVDGSLPLIKNQFAINDSQSALINTLSSITHSLSLALIWIFGDFASGKYLLSTSVFGWCISNILSLSCGSASFWLFIVFRSISSAFNSIFGVLIPVILADLFEDAELAKALTCLSLSEIMAGIFSTSMTSWIIISSLPWFV
ncbi:hypothetical protein PFISCL1PPCAC_15285, partial [Pristionchus fissidentatus]